MMKLLFDWTAFSEHLLFKDPCFFQSSYTFSQQLLFQKMLLFRTANLWLLTLFSQLYFSIYHLVVNSVNTGAFWSKLPGGAQSGYTSQKIFLLIPWTQILHRICFHREALNNLSCEKCKKFFGVFNKNILLNFSTESAKKQQFITCYSSLHFILLKMTISSSLKW